MSSCIQKIWGQITKICNLNDTIMEKHAKQKKKKIYVKLSF